MGIKYPTGQGTPTIAFVQVVNQEFTEVTMRILALGMVVLMGTNAMNAAVQTKVVEYRQGNAVLEGYLAWDDASQDQRPGVLVVHEWTGLGDYVKTRARKLAEGLGYVAFAADIYGKGIRPKTPQEAAAQVGIYKDRPLRTGESITVGITEVGRCSSISAASRRRGWAWRL